MLPSPVISAVAATDEDPPGTDPGGKTRIAVSIGSLVSECTASAMSPLSASVNGWSAGDAVEVSK
jgi:hypothetical protein